MHFPDPIHDGTFTKRLNRFLASIRVDEKEEYAHVPNSGRMAELLTPGRPVKLRKRSSLRRKTQYDLSLVSYNGRWVSIDARLPAVLLAESVGKSSFPEFAGYFLLRREVAYGSSRIDLLVSKGNGLCLVEAKSVTLVNGEMALFPDAPTARGARHILDLTEAMGEGYEAWVAFVCQRGDARLFSPHHLVDPDFSKTLRIAYDEGLKVFAFNCEVTEREITLKERIPVIL